MPATLLTATQFAEMIELATRNAITIEEHKLVGEARAHLAFYRATETRNTQAYSELAHAVVALADLAARSLKEPNEKRQVLGSRGETHIQKRFGDVWVCSCQGFKFRSRCKHVAAVKEVA